MVKGVKSQSPTLLKVIGTKSFDIAQKTSVRRINDLISKSKDLKLTLGYKDSTYDFSLVLAVALTCEFYTRRNLTTYVDDLSLPTIRRILESESCFSSLSEKVNRSMQEENQALLDLHKLFGVKFDKYFVNKVFLIWQRFTMLKMTYQELYQVLFLYLCLEKPHLTASYFKETLIFYNLFGPLTMNCVVNFVSRIAQGENYKDAQVELKDGIFKSMTVKKSNGDPLLYKKGRQFFRLVAFLLYELNRQHPKLIQVSHTFVEYSVSDFMTACGVGRSKSMLSVFSESGCAIDDTFNRLVLLDCEPESLQIHLSESKLEAVAGATQMKVQVHLLTIILAQIFAQIEQGYFVTKTTNMMVTKAESSLKGDIDSLRQSLLKKSNKVTELTQLLKNCQDELFDCKKDLLSKDAIIKDLSNQSVIKAKDIEINDLRGLVDAKSADYSSLYTQYSSLLSHCEALENKISDSVDVTKELADLKEKYAELTESFNGLLASNLNSSVTIPQIKEFCWGIKPVIVGGVKGFDKTLARCFKDFVFIDVDDVSNGLTLPTAPDCVVIYARCVGHADVRRVREFYGDRVPFIQVSVSNALLLMTRVYEALNNGK